MINKSVLSKSISFLRFPLILCFVCAHSDIRVANETIAQLPIFGYVFGKFIGYVCVPTLYMFFFISGFLFFHEHHFGKSLYLTKLKKRTRSLLVPYLSWNALAFLAIWLCQALSPDFSMMLKKQVADFRWFDYLLVFWDKHLITGLAEDWHVPLLLQFWFIQCLIVIAIVSPVIWIGIKKLDWLFVVLLGLLFYFFPVSDYAGLRTEAFFYFTLGAYFSTKQSWWDILLKPVHLLAATAVSLTISFFVAPFFIAFCISFILLMFAATYRYIERNGRLVAPICSLADATFFIFGLHAFIAGIFIHAVERISITWTEPAALAVFVAGVVLNICLCILAQRMTRRILPNLYIALNGGR